MNINKFTLVFRWVSKNAWRNKQLVVVVVFFFFLKKGYNTMQYNVLYFERVDT